MRKLFIFKCKDCYFTKQGGWSLAKTDALVVDDWAVEFYLEGKFKDIGSSVELIEVDGEMK